MAEKIWIASDIRMLDLTVKRIDNNLEITSKYQFVDINGVSLAGINIKYISRLVPIASIPQNVLTALQAIDHWRKQQALTEEGME